MNSTGEPAGWGITDAQVSAAYRDAAREMSPPHLDQKILRDAAREIGSKRGLVWGVGWLRPVTFLVTAGLSVALLLEISEFQNNSLPSTNETYVPEPAMPIVTNAEMRAQPAAAKADAEQSSGEPGPGTAAAPVNSLQPNSDRDSASEFRRAADDTAKQVQAVDAEASATLQEMPKVEVVSELTDAAPDATARGIESGQLECTDLQRARPEDWWLCIKDLRTAGLLRQAEVELQNLQEAFPAYPGQ